MKSTIIYQGGLGNQLFQYAFQKHLEQNGILTTANTYDYKKINEHNGFELSKLWGISDNPSALDYYLFKILFFFFCRSSQNIIYKSIYKIISFCTKRIVTEDNYIEETNICYSKFHNAIIYYGYWSAPKFFSSIKDSITDIIKFDESMVSEKTRNILSWIEENNNVVSIHIRRGDYLQGKNKDIYGGICTDEYYKNAIEYICQKLDNPKFLIFSNDMDYVRTNFDIPQSKIVDFNQKSDSWQDLFIMSKCHHNIIANSTFSWWGAYLNENSNKIVITPTKFNNIDSNTDIILQEWVKISSK